MSDDMLPTTDEYRKLKQIAEMQLDEARKRTDEPLSVELRIDPTLPWEFSVCVTENEVTSEKRRLWTWAGAAEELAAMEELGDA